MTYLLLLGLAAVVGWFAFFTLLIIQEFRAGKTVAEGYADPIGRRLVGGAKWAFIIGLGTWFAYSGLAAADTAFGLDLALRI